MPTSKLSTKDVIRFLPMDKKVKDVLQDRYPDKLSYELKSTIEELVWDLYYEYYDMVYTKNLEEEIAKKAGPLEAGYQDRVLAKTEEDMGKEVEMSLSSTSIEEIRGKLQQLIP